MTVSLPFHHRTKDNTSRKRGILNQVAAQMFPWFHFAAIIPLREEHSAIVIFSLSCKLGGIYSHAPLHTTCRCIQ